MTTVTWTWENFVKFIEIFHGWTYERQKGFVEGLKYILEAKP